MRVFVALGSNWGERQDTIDGALRSLASLPKTSLVRASRPIETKPVDCPPESPDFLNAVALLETDLSANELLLELQRIEHEYGRERGARHAPRTLDLDLLLYGDEVLDDAALTVPHPRMQERLFVLEPLLEIAPDARDPKSGKRYADIRDGLHA